MRDARPVGAEQRNQSGSGVQRLAIDGRQAPERSRADAGDGDASTP